MGTWAASPAGGRKGDFGGKGEKKPPMAVEGMGQGHCEWQGLMQIGVQSCATPQKGEADNLEAALALRHAGECI